jgi:hypothetical protein
MSAATIAQNAEPPHAKLAYHDPKKAPTLARLERLVGHPVDPAKVRAAIGTFEVAPARPLLARSPGVRATVEAMVALREPALELDPIDPFPAARTGRWAPRRSFTLLEVTSGLPDDSRDEDQQARTLVERQRQGRVRAAQAALGAADPQVAAQVFRDQGKLARFCARFSITPADICPHQAEVSPAGTRCSWCRGSHGAFRPIRVEDVTGVLSSPCDPLAEVRAREAAILPGAEG